MSAPAAEAAGGVHARLRAALLAASAAGDGDGVPGTEARGQLIRPLVALAGAEGEEPAGFWDAALAVQLAHEASLLHDDVIDGARERRGEPTLAAAAGVAQALVRGDHLLTAAYRAAARTGSLPFVTCFARAVERTVAAEVAQGRSAGEELGLARYDEIATGKAGELLGCALAAAALLRADAGADERYALGRRLGLLYQRLDDLLDYCPLAETGKPPLADWSQRRWTWVLEEMPGTGFGAPAAEARDAFHRPGPGGSPAARALARLEREAAALRAALAASLPGDRLLTPLVEEWMQAAREALRREAERHRPPAPARAAPGALAAVLAARVPHPERVEAYLGAHSRSFRFATRFFPRVQAERVARVYAYCRVTDDLVDRPGAEDPAALLEAWVGLSRRAYAGEATGLPLLDAVMRDAAAAGVPFEYPAELAEGMRMDLRGERYRTALELRRYTYRVASVVGLWITRLFGVHDPAVLERAERMGHAMQLTNILRDVGEDHAAGRLYLPADLLAAHGVDEDALARMCAGAPLVPGWAALVESQLRAAEEDYALALEAVPLLPPALARPVAVAAHVYRGIHDGIRAHGYDNLRRRAYTAPLAKGVLAARALWELRRAPACAGEPRAVLALGGGE